MAAFHHKNQSVSVNLAQSIFSPKSSFVQKAQFPAKKEIRKAGFLSKKKGEILSPQMNVASFPKPGHGMTPSLGVTQVTQTSKGQQEFLEIPQKQPSITKEGILQTAQSMKALNRQQHALSEQVDER